MKRTKSKVHIGVQVWYPSDVKTPADRQAFLRTQSMPMPLRALMPCGKVYVFFHLEDIPIEDMECECGDRSHWLVLWRGC